MTNRHTSLVKGVPMNDAGNRVANFLFGLTLAAAAAMAAGVIAAPYLLSDPGNASDLALLFARDMTVRRTAFFCAIGLVATAFIFFRPETLKKKKKSPSVNMSGA